MTGYEVGFYCGSNGKSDILDFIEKCDIKLQSKINRQILYIEEYGLNRVVPNLRKIVGTEFWELRVLGKDNIRLFCFQKGRVITIINIFNKKGQKTPLKEIEITRQRIRGLTYDI